MSILGRISGNLPFRGGRGGAPASTPAGDKKGPPPGPPPIQRPAGGPPPRPAGGPPPITGQRKSGDRPPPPPIGGPTKNPNDPKWNRQTSHIQPRELSPEEHIKHRMGAIEWDKKSRALSHETGTGHWKRDEPAHGGKYGDKSEYEIYANPVGPRQEEQRHADKKAQEHRDALEGHRMATRRPGPPPIPTSKPAEVKKEEPKGPPPPPPIAKKKTPPPRPQQR